MAGQTIKRAPNGRFGEPPLAIEWNHQHRVHQSSVKAMEVLPLSESELLILTGGDDNAVSISRLHLSALNSTDSFSTILVPQAHAAAVNAINITKTPENHKNGGQQLYFASSGNDQRLKEWSVQINPQVKSSDGVKASLHRDTYTSVADISTVGHFVADENGQVRDQVLVCGVGMDVWRLNYT